MVRTTLSARSHQSEVSTLIAEGWTLWYEVGCLQDRTSISRHKYGQASISYYWDILCVHPGRRSSIYKQCNSMHRYYSSFITILSITHWYHIYLNPLTILIIIKKEECICLEKNVSLLHIMKKARHLFCLTKKH